jgi:hypothetical protein
MRAEECSKGIWALRYSRAGSEPRSTLGRATLSPKNRSAKRRIASPARRPCLKHRCLVNTAHVAAARPGSVLEGRLLCRGPATFDA